MLSSRVLKPKPHYNHCIFSIKNIFQEIQALNRRLFIQVSRRLISIFSGIIQPLLWLILFGALFNNIPMDIFNKSIKYTRFLSAGIIVFTAFTAGLNAGLPIIFDREFGFFNRLLTSPLNSRFSIFFASTYFIIIISLLQIGCILLFSEFLGSHIPNIQALIVIINIIFIITIGITLISIALAFLLPGHIQLLALILVISLPLLFSSTALAPLSIMPHWLQIVASFNPLTYAIEVIRYVYFIENFNLITPVIDTIWGKLSLRDIFLNLIQLDIAIIVIVYQFLTKKFK
uniref:ABC transporter n=1 Tax=Boldia erythrosiphon TaxID=74908 RepID=A0A1Y9TLZ1_9RHOD|nr:ABC transporter [Boldia erythrosiphon]ARO90632.1 ABC transporter [Boldia erythrosiphon]